MDFSLLFDKNKNIDVRGLLAAIVLPLALLLAYNIGILLLIAGKLIAVYHNIAIVWLIDAVNLLFFFYAAYSAVKVYKLRLISSILSSIVCYIILLVVLYLTTEYLIANNIGNFKNAVMAEDYSMPNELKTPLSQVWGSPRCDYGEISKTSKLECKLLEFGKTGRIIIGFMLVLFFGILGTAAGLPSKRLGER